MAGRKITLAGGKIIFAGGKIILADGKNFWQMSLFSRTGHHSPYDDSDRTCRRKAGYGLVLIMMVASYISRTDGQTNKVILGLNIGKCEVAGPWEIWGISRSSYNWEMI